MRLGELRPQELGSLLGVPPELADRDWLAAHYERDGDMAIALQLGVSRRIVREARERLGIVSKPPGRRRGVERSTVRADRTLELLAEQLASETAAPSEGLLAGRMMVAHQERMSGGAGYDDALIRLASAACLLVRERRRLRAA